MREANIRHVYPVSDAIEHATDGDDCPCGDGNIGYVVLHNCLSPLSPAADYGVSAGLLWKRYCQSHES